jgi:probable phosphoglycerate mutase
MGYRKVADVVGTHMNIRIEEEAPVRAEEVVYLADKLVEVKKRFPDKWRERGENLFFFRPAGGESFSDLCDRVLPAFETIAEAASGNTLIVAHAGVNRMILCRVLGMAPENLFRLGQDYAGLNMVDCRKKPYRVIAMNISQ